MYYAYAMFKDGRNTTICVSVTETKKEAFDPFVDALSSTKKFADVRNVGAAVWWMAHSALRELGKDDGRAYTPIMSVFGRAAMPKEVADGIKAIIKEKQRTGEIDSPWEIFELMLGRVHGSGKTN